MVLMAGKHVLLRVGDFKVLFSTQEKEGLAGISLEGLMGEGCPKFLCVEACFSVAT